VVTCIQRLESCCVDEELAVVVNVSAIGNDGVAVDLNVVDCYFILVRIGVNCYAQILAAALCPIGIVKLDLVLGLNGLLTCCGDCSLFDMLGIVLADAALRRPLWQ
jgi:hypothetical protein